MGNTLNINLSITKNMKKLSRFIDYLILVSVIFIIGCSHTYKLKSSNTVGDWYCVIDKNIGGFNISAKTKLIIKRNGPGDYEYQTETTITDEMYGGLPKTEYSNGKIEKEVMNYKWHFINGDFGNRDGYIVIPHDKWDDYKPTEITIQFSSGKGDSMIFNNDKNINNSNLNFNNTTSKTTVTFSEAEEFMQQRCNAVNQTLMKKKSVVFNGTKLYMFLSVAQNGQACISSISEDSLEVLAADCGEAMVKIQQWNDVN